MPPIARESCATLSVADFYRRYMLPNQPVLIDISALTALWRVRSEWTREQAAEAEEAAAEGEEQQAKKQRAATSAARQLDAAAVRAACGAEEVTVHNCAPAAGRVMGRLHTAKMSLDEYLRWWEAHCAARGGAAGAAAAANEARAAQLQRLSELSPTEPEAEAEAEAGLDDSLLYYLKDWNFVKDHESDVQLYTRPPYFAEDWLNDHEAEQSSDHRFVYLGPADTFTPLHKDVLNSFSWSVNITGRKRWWMLPPSSEAALMSTRTGTQLFDLRDLDTSDELAAEFPALPALLAEGGELMDFEQGVDEVLFVPSGWWHQVQNLEDTLSVNHNWLNACNVRWSWSYLQQQHARIVKEVPECDGDEETTQQLLEFKYE